MGKEFFIWIGNLRFVGNVAFKFFFANFVIFYQIRNNYYGADTASLGLADLYKKFRGDEPPKKELGHPRSKLLTHSFIHTYRTYKKIMHS